MRLASYILFLGSIIVNAAETPAPEVRRLSLEDCLQIALEHNLDIKIQRYNPELARFTLGASYGAYDPTFNFRADHSYNMTPGGIDDFGRQYLGTESESDSFAAGFSGLLPWGLEYSLGANVMESYGSRPIFGSLPSVVTNSFVDINTGNTITFVSTNAGRLASREDFDNTQGRVGVLSLRQPLLKDFWIDSTRLQIYLNRRNLQISELELRNQIIQTVTLVEEAYYNLIFSLDNIDVQRKALEWAERQFSEDRKRVEVGALAPLREKQSQAQAAASRANLLAAEGTADTAQRLLKNLLSDDYSKWANVVIDPTLVLLAVPQSLDLQESWRNGLRLRPDLQQQRINLEKQGVIIKYQKNQLLPQLDLTGSYGYSASADEYHRAFEQWTDRDNPFWSGGAQLSVPVTRRAAKENYRSAKSSKEQMELMLRQLEQGVLIQVENALANVRTIFQRVAATKEARIYAQEAVDAEEKMLLAGKSTSFEVLRLQRDLTSARSEEIRALADYNIALARLAMAEGITLERRQVNLEVR